MVGSDVTIVKRTDKCIDLTGIRDHTVKNLNIVHAAFVAKTRSGCAIPCVPSGMHGRWEIHIGPTSDGNIRRVCM